GWQPTRMLPHDADLIHLTVLHNSHSLVADQTASHIPALTQPRSCRRCSSGPVPVGRKSRGCRGRSVGGGEQQHRVTLFTYWDDPRHQALSDAVSVLQGLARSLMPRLMASRRYSGVLCQTGLAAPLSGMSGFGLLRPYQARHPTLLTHSGL